MEEQKFSTFSIGEIERVGQRKVRGVAEIGRVENPAHLGHRNRVGTDRQYWAGRVPRSSSATDPRTTLSSPFLP